jgi:hypothetical protein
MRNRNRRVQNTMPVVVRQKEMSGEGNGVASAVPKNDRL